MTSRVGNRPQPADRPDSLPSQVIRQLILHGLNLRDGNINQAQKLRSRFSPRLQPHDSPRHKAGETLMCCLFSLSDHRRSLNQHNPLTVLLGKKLVEIPAGIIYFEARWSLFSQAGFRYCITEA